MMIAMSYIFFLFFFFVSREMNVPMQKRYFSSLSFFPIVRTVSTEVRTREWGREEKKCRLSLVSLMPILYVVERVLGGHTRSFSYQDTYKWFRGLHRCHCSCFSRIPSMFQAVSDDVNKFVVFTIQDKIILVYTPISKETLKSFLSFSLLSLLFFQEILQMY